MPDRTEAPTPRRIANARRKGQVVKSVELNAAIALLIGVWMIQGPAQQLTQGIGWVIKDSITHLFVEDITTIWLKETVYKDISTFIGPMIEIALVMMIVGTGATLLQTGFMWASERSFFDFSRVNPISGFKRIFSVRGLFELGKSLLKLVVIGWVAYATLSSNADKIITLAQMDLSSGIGTFMGLAATLIWRVAGAYFILAVIDFLYQRWDFLRNMKMTRQEVLDEYKQTEGDPLLRGRIREQQRRAARQRMMSQVPKADVIITNPTHLAVAIQYNGHSMKAPKLLAKGAQLVAQRIVDLARKNKVPVIQNIPLARAMYKLVEIDQEIPPELYKAMAEVLAYVYRQKSKGITPNIMEMNTGLAE